MLTIDEIRELLDDLESDRMERTASTTNTDKFFASKATVVERGQATCAFANDLPDHRLPGYLFLGVDALPKLAKVRTKAVEDGAAEVMTTTAVPHLCFHCCHLNNRKFIQ